MNEESKGSNFGISDVDNNYAKTAFIGQKNFFSLLVTHWLSKKTDLKFCFWVNKTSWNSSAMPGRRKRIAKYFLNRAKKQGYLKTLNEILYFAFYKTFIGRNDSEKLRRLVKRYWQANKMVEINYKEIFVEDIASENLVRLIKDNDIDAMFSMCIDIKIPEKIFSAPRLGTFLWHEGITPEYKGLYSAFWALYNRDYEKIGYTLLKINKTIDGGKIFVQGQAKDIDPLKDCWGYLAHKSIYDSLPEVELFLKKLETSSPEEIVRVNAPSKYYTRPGLTQLLSILIYRLTQYAKMKHRS